MTDVFECVNDIQSAVNAKTVWKVGVTPSCQVSSEYI